MKRISPVILVGIILTLLCCVFYVRKVSFVDNLSNYAYDAFLRKYHDDPQSGMVAVVDLDEQSLAEYGQWPWPRYLVAMLTANLLNSGAKVVGFDVVFPEKDRTSLAVIKDDMKRYFDADIKVTGLSDDLMDSDAIFADVIAQGNVVLGCNMQFSKDRIHDVDTSNDPYFHSPYHAITKSLNLDVHDSLTQAQGVTISIPELNKVAGTAFFNAVPDPDGVVRSNPLLWAFGDNRIYPALALECVRIALNIPQGIIKFDKQGITEIVLRDYVIPTDSIGRMIVNYRSIKKNANTGFVSSFPTYSAMDILNGTVGKKEIAGKIILIGTSAVGLKDLKASPLTQYLSGVEVHATMIDNILSNDILSKPSWLVGVHIVTIIFVGLFLSIFISKGRSWLSFLVSIAVILLSIKMCIRFMIKDHIVFIPAWIITFVAVLYPVLTMIKFWQEEHQKKKVRNMFGTMVSEDVLHYLENNPESFSLTGQKTEATMFFSDVAGFTTMSENLQAQQLSDLLNKYLSPMTDIIMRRRGYVDKYEGDLIMAEWGVPYDTEDHALQACLAAIEQQELLEQLRPELKKEFGHEIHVRMGVNSGIVTAGNMGSDRRFQYTVMGDSVNLASRLEPTNNEYGTKIIIGETTYLATVDDVETRFLDKIQVKGKTQAINIYELIAKKGNISENKLRLIALYEEGLALHWKREWAEALKCFKAALELDPDDRPSAIMRERVVLYQKDPPPDSWRGEYIRTTKN